MRILHTSDWHLGRSFHRVGMLDAQAAFVDHLVDVVRSEKVDVVLVAGDVYDRALPSVDVVGLLDDALARLVDAGTTVVLSSGNHDSARRLGFGSRLFEAARVHVRTRPQRCGQPVLLQDSHGPVALYPLPYLEPAIAAPLLGCLPSADASTRTPESAQRLLGHETVLTAAMDAVRCDLSSRPRGTRSVVAAHAFVMGGLASDSERDISVGGVAVVSSSVFDGVDYAALGHLHGRQRISETVRYSGSPLAYSFSEYQHVKSSWLVTLDAQGVQTVEAVEAPVPRPLAILTGSLDELLRDPRLTGQEVAWCQVTLTDPERPAEAMQRLRTRFPHTLELRFRPEGVAEHVEQTYVERVSGRDDVDVCCGFVEHVRGRTPNEAEVTWLREAVAAGRLVEVEETGVAVERSVRREIAAAAAVAARQEEAAAEALTLLDLPETARHRARRTPRTGDPSGGPAAGAAGSGHPAHPADQQLSLEDVG